MYYRQARESDWPHICKIIQAGQKSWPGNKSESTEFIIKRLSKDIPGKKIYLLDGAVASWLPEIYSVEPRPEASAGDIHLSIFFIPLEQQGSGLATRLLKISLEKMRAEGARHVRLWTPEEALRARSFYEREGWSHSGRKIYYAERVRLEYLRDLA
jgi:GNAT superfamily N-acetyltransferase